MLLPFEKVSKKQGFFEHAHEFLIHDKKRKIIVKKKAGTNPDYGCLPDQRATEELLNYSIVNINKPSGPTSHQVSDFVKKILDVTKAGHSGTLDPGVIGVLPVAVGDGTKVIQAILNAGKEYVCFMKLHKVVDEKQIRDTLNSFVGKIKQLPPVKSAIKRQVREKEIYYIEILEINKQNVLFRVGCQAGTYMRKLCHDIGKKLGTGAHMQELVRTKAGPFKLENTVTLQDLKDALWYYKNENNEKFLRKILQPIENAVVHLPKVWIQDNTVDSICHGAKLAIPGIVKLESGIKESDLVAVLTLKDELVSLGVSRMSSEEMMKKNSGIGVRTDRVFMKIGTYPKSKK